MLSEKIKKYLDDKGIKYGFVADGIGVSVSTFSGMINGKRKITAEEYFAICNFLCVGLDFFIEGENDIE